MTTTSVTQIIKMELSKCHFKVLLLFILLINTSQQTHFTALYACLTSS